MFLKTPQKCGVLYHSKTVGRSDLTIMEKNGNEVDDVIKMLDNLTQSGVSRIKVETSGEIDEGERKKAYHHGRCDVGSPFATGKLFDAEEPDCG